MVGNIKIHYEGETAIDLTDPEDFKMMAILRNTEVTFSPNQFQNTLLIMEAGFRTKILHFFLQTFCPRSLLNEIAVCHLVQML